VQKHCVSGGLKVRHKHSQSKCDDVLGNSPATYVGAGNFDNTYLEGAQQSGYGFMNQQT